MFNFLRKKLSLFKNVEKEKYGKYKTKFNSEKWFFDVLFLMMSLIAVRISSSRISIYTRCGSVYINYSSRSGIAFRTFVSFLDKWILQCWFCYCYYLYIPSTARNNETFKKLFNFTCFFRTKPKRTSFTWLGMHQFQS